MCVFKRMFPFIIGFCFLFQIITACSDTSKRQSEAPVVEEEEEAQEEVAPPAEENAGIKVPSISDIGKCPPSEGNLGEKLLKTLPRNCNMVLLINPAAVFQNEDIQIMFQVIPTRNLNPNPLETLESLKSLATIFSEIGYCTNTELNSYIEIGFIKDGEAIDKLREAISNVFQIQIELNTVIELRELGVGVFLYMKEDMYALGSRGLVEGIKNGNLGPTLDANRTVVQLLGLSGAGAFKEVVFNLEASIRPQKSLLLMNYAQLFSQLNQSLMSGAMHEGLKETGIVVGWDINSHCSESTIIKMDDFTELARSIAYVVPTYYQIIKEAVEQRAAGQ